MFVHFSDRVRTSVNVLGDGLGAGIIHHMTKKRLLEADQLEQINELRCTCGMFTKI